MPDAAGGGLGGARGNQLLLAPGLALQKNAWWAQRKKEAEDAVKGKSFAVRAVGVSRASCLTRWFGRMPYMHAHVHVLCRAEQRGSLSSLTAERGHSTGSQRIRDQTVYLENRGCGALCSASAQMVRME